MPAITQLTKKHLCYLLHCTDPNGAPSYRKLKRIFDATTLERVGIPPEKWPKIRRLSHHQAKRIMVEFDLTLEDLIEQFPDLLPKSYRQKVTPSRDK